MGRAVLVDWPLERLRDHLPERDEPADFRAFWRETLQAARAQRFPARFTPHDSGLSLIQVWDVEFAGYGGHPVRGWLLLPRDADRPLPCVVQYAGYGDGRGFPHERLTWSAAGYSCLVMDTRGQGSNGTLVGATPDPDPTGLPNTPGFMTRGIVDRDAYYYRRVFTDAVLAVETAREHPLVDPERVAVAGASQGGGIALAVAGLADGVAAALVDVPFLCSYRRAVDITDKPPYAEITKYCATHRDEADAVFATLRYFDGVNFAAHARAPALFSVGLMDAVCPPSTVFAAYNHYAGDKDIRVWPYNGHEGGGGFQRRDQLRRLRALL